MKLSQRSILNPARCKTLITNTFAYIDLLQSKVLRLRVFLEKPVAICMAKNLPDFYATRKFDHHVYKRPPVDLTISQLNPVQTSVADTHFHTIHPNSHPG